MDKIKNSYGITVETNSIKDKGDGKTIEFTNGLTITDDSEQRNGTRYDIKSMDISEYDGMITADHSMSISEIIGKTYGVRKIRNRVIVEGIEFATEISALAKFAYDMIKAGYARNFSIETFGKYPDDEGVYHESKLVGLSLVTLGNNRSAAINELATNSLNESKKLGLDTKNLEQLVLSQSNLITEKTMEKETEVKVETPVETPVVETPKEETPVEKKDEVAEAVNSMKAEIASLKKTIFDNSATEPKFKKAVTGNSVTDMGWKQRYGKQVASAWALLKQHDFAAGQVLSDINKFNLEELQKAGKVDNTLTIADFGSFVISPELLTQIEGVRSDFASLLARFPFQDTLSLQMAWLNRASDISMSEVEMCDDGANGNLKPISEYTATIRTSNLHELAAVTPVCNAATRFLAVDLLSDVATGYRNDFDRKKAQLVIARLQQAVDTTGQTIVYNTSTTGATAGVNALTSFIDVIASITNEITGGVWIMNEASKWEIIKRAVASGLSGDVLGVVKSGDLSPILGSPSIIVPNELMPTLNTAGTKTFTVEGVSVTINKAVFYVNPSVWSGRTSGGLMYDLSTDAAYEDGATVKSAFQRNELVLRGSFFRGGAVRDTSRVSALQAAGLS
jgi:hypothetical protein